MALNDAHHLIRSVRRHFERVSAVEGWSVSVTAVRYLILEQLRNATAFGLTPRRLGHLLDLPPSTLAHHLDRLEVAGLIQRHPRGLYDRRYVTVRATAEGRYAARRLESVLRRSVRP